MQSQARCTTILAFMCLMARIVSGAAFGEACSANSPCADTKEFCIEGTCACGPLYAENGGSNGCEDTSCAAPNAEACATLGNAVCSTGDICACASTHKEDTDTGTCVSKVLGDSCTATTECSAVTNAFCLNDVCACGPLYTASSTTCDSTACTAEDTTPCDSLGNAACTNNICACASTHKEDTETGTCVSKVLGDSCTATTECSGVTNAFCLNDECACGPLYTESSTTCDSTGCADANIGACDSLGNAVCSTGDICACASTHKEDTETGLCVSKGLGHACTATTECSAVTNAFCLSDVCACGPLYTESSTTCVAKGCADTNAAACDSLGNAVCSTGDICACASTHKEDTETGVCVLKGLGDSCTATTECSAVTNAFCLSDECACGPLYTELSTTCVAKGCADTNAAACDSLGNAVCSTGDICACASTHKEDTETGACVLKVINDACTVVGDCDFANSACTDGKCQCAVEFTEIGGFCVKDIGDSCTATTECSAVTNAFCLTGVCACGPLYTESSTTCVAKACSETPKTCADVDNSACNDDDKCICASGYTMDATTGVCVTAGNGCAAILVSVSLMLVSVLSAVFVN